jgi:hypothetical protein
MPPDFLKDPSGGAVGYGVPPDAAPFVAENVIDSNEGAAVTVPVNIVAWTVPPNSLAVLEYYSLLVSSPFAYYDCLFDLAVNGKRVSNIQFTQIQDGQERPPNFVRTFTERQVISLRLYKRDNFGNAGEGFVTLILLGRLSGKHWPRRSN